MNREEKLVLVNGVMEGETLKAEESRNLVGNGYRCVIKSEKLNFYVNGKEVLDDKVDPEWTLLWYLRNKLGLTGTKLGCAEGGCGACTVMVSKMNRSNGKIIHLAVNACLTPVCAMHGLAVTTVEGIGSVRTKLHPVQERIAKAHGSQCGFCTPGMVMSMYALLRSVPKPTAENLEIAFQGNLCRCTGYRAIVEGFNTFIEDWERSRSCLPERGIGKCAMGDACCKRAFSSASIPNEIFDASKFRPYDPTQEPIFPPRLQLSSDLDEQYLVIKGENVTWYRPTKLVELLELKQRHPDAKIVVGNTEVGVEVKFKRSVYPVLVQPCLIREMHEVTETSTSLRIGASVTLNELEDVLKHRLKTKPEHRTRIFSAIINMLHWFAGKQIRNVAAVGGNVMTGSPISDLNPVFMAAGVKLNLCSLRNGQKTVEMDHTFFVGYRRNVVAPEEVLISIEIPFSNKDQYLVAFKQARRREDDIAIVNMALNVSFEAGTDVVREAHLTFGGMAPTTVFARKTCSLLIGRKWEKTILEPVYDSLLEELPLADNAPGGMIKYRRSLTLSLFLKGFVRIATALQLSLTNVEALPEELKDAGESFHYKVPKSSQYYEVVSKDQESHDPIGRPIVHASAYKQASGEAIYLDDLPKLNGELYLSLVLSTRAHAKILRIDPSKALAIGGVVAFFSSKDLPAEKKVGPIFHDEEVFVSEKVTSQGQIIGAIVAIDQATAQKATKMVEIEYEDIQPIIISMEDAIEHEAFFSNSSRSIVKGDADLAFAESDHILEGEVKTGGQEHFYFETHSSYAIPRDEDELEIFSSTQHPSEVQRLVAYVLDMPINKIAMRVKRIGGGFGGKESRAIIVTIPVALAAHRLRRPVRCMLDRDEDMMTSGTRHPFLFKYKVGFNKNGVINVVKINIYNNGGYSRDLSISVLERAVFHFENSYRIPVSHVHGIVCKTNLPSNTAFRGFGGPQGMFAAETMIRQIAEFLKMDVLEVAERNLYKEGDVTHYNQVLTNCTMERCWQECLALSRYKERLVKVERYNKEHRFRKRGIAVVPTKFGIAFTAIFLNQAAALVHVYTDGSILLSHGGVEMGQGLHTKMIQIASRVLKVPSSKIHIAETATDKVPNTSATAASSGSDLNGMAVLNACAEIIKRLQPIINANSNGTWEEWIKTAYLERISLSATGFYAMPDVGYSFDTNSGLAFNYFTYGAACSEVEIDCLTGDHQVLRTDIVMDLGQSLNPAIDVGQVEGAFVQGYGLFTLEETVYSPTGIVFTRGPGAYKLPGFADIPHEFNVSLLKGVSNPRAVYSSKAVGEPPLFLASSVFFAIKEAIKAARKDMNIEGHFRLDTPATAARIRTACVDNLTMKIPEPDIKRQWNVVP